MCLCADFCSGRLHEVAGNCHPRGMVAQGTLCLDRTRLIDYWQLLLCVCGKTARFFKALLSLFLDYYLRLDQGQWNIAEFDNFQIKGIKVTGQVVLFLLWGFVFDFDLLCQHMLLTCCVNCQHRVGGL